MVEAFPHIEHHRSACRDRTISGASNGQDSTSWDYRGECRAGWARESHIPAVQQLAGLELAAVANKGQASADAAARAFGAPKAYGDAAALLRDPEIDLVTIAVTLRGHHDLILAALEAGKHIYCEYPLGLEVGQSQAIAAEARSSGVHTVIGLQARANPAVRRARALIEAGAIGRVLTARVYSATIGFGARTAPAEAYTEEQDNGVTVVTIQGVHTIDLVTALLGDVQELTALTSRQYPEVQIGNSPMQPRTTYDHLLVQARYGLGAVASVEVAGGRPAGTPFQLDVVGADGVLSLSGGAPRGFQSGRLTLALDGAAQTVDEGEVASLPDAAANVAGLYAALRDDITTGSFTVPDFDQAVRVASVIAAAEASSLTGVRVRLIG